MNILSRRRILAVGAVASLAVLAGLSLLAMTGRGDPKNSQANAAPFQPAIPRIDTDRPTATKTATFSLG